MQTEKKISFEKFGSNLLNGWYSLPVVDAGPPPPGALAVVV